MPHRRQQYRLRQLGLISELTDSELREKYLSRTERISFREHRRILEMIRANGWEIEFRMWIGYRYRRAEDEIVDYPIRHQRTLNGEPLALATMRRMLLA